MKKSILVSLLLLLGVSASAQFALGGQVNFSKYFAGNPSFFGFGVNASAVIADSYPIRLSINFGLPKTQTLSGSVEALNDSTDPKYITVTDDEKITLLNFWLDAQKYFGDGGYEDGGMYGFFGIGFTAASYKSNLSSYDHTLYQEVPNDPSSGQFGIRLGLGYDKSFDFGNLFLEAGLNLSANEENGQQVEVKLPSFLLVNVGVRHWLGSSGSSHGKSHGKSHSKSHGHSHGKSHHHH